MTRAEHLEWCKKRALEFVDEGKMHMAFASMVSDLRKHPETENHPAIDQWAKQIGRMVHSPEEMRKFIEEFR